MDKNGKLINIIKALIIAVVAIVLVLGIAKVLLLKSEDGINQFQAFYKQPENSIDVIFSGSSKVYCDIATGVLWENHGIAAFDLGGAEAPSWVSYYQIKEALKTQKPKVICYEVSVAAMYDMLTQANNWSTDNSYGMKWNSNRIDLLRVDSDEEQFIERLNPYNIMHGRYKDLEENDFTNVRDSVNYKGFDPRDRVNERETPDNAGITDCTPCTEKEEEYIRKLIELTRSEGIDLVMFASPYCVTDREQEILNYVGNIAEEEGVEFIDFNRRYDELGMDFSSDMADSGHLNYSGNYKFTDYFGKLLKENHDIPDRRGDSRYVSWDWDAAIQNYERNASAIANSDSAADIMNMTKNGYILFAVYDGKASIIKDGEVVAEGYEGFRIPYRYGGDSFLFKEFNEGEFEHYAILYINDDEIKQNYGNMMYVYDTVRHEYIRHIYF